MSKQDRQGVRTAEQIERKYRLGQTGKVDDLQNAAREATQGLKRMEQNEQRQNNEIKALREKVVALEGTALHIRYVQESDTVYIGFGVDPTADGETVDAENVNYLILGGDV